MRIHVHPVYLYLHLWYVEYICIYIYDIININLDQMYLLCSLAIFSMPLLWPSLPAHRIYTHSIPILLPIAHMGLTGKSLSLWFFTRSDHGTVPFSISSLLFHNIFLLFIFQSKPNPGSIYTMVAVGIERYITVCHPFFKITHNWGAYKWDFLL